MSKTTILLLVFAALALAQRGGRRPEVQVIANDSPVTVFNEMWITFTFSDCVEGFTIDSFDVTPRGAVYTADTFQEDTPNQVYSFKLESMETNVQYCISVPNNSVTLATRGQSGPGNQASNQICVSSLPPSTMTTNVSFGDRVVDSEITVDVVFPREANPRQALNSLSLNICCDSFGAPLLNTQTQQRIKSMKKIDTMGTSWQYAVRVQNQERITAQLESGGFFDAAGSPNMLSNQVSRDLVFDADCISFVNKTPWSPCCGGNRCRDVSVEITQEAQGNGQGCPTVNPQECETCTFNDCPTASCFDEIGGNSCFSSDTAAGQSCFCTLDCYSFGDCCPDMDYCSGRGGIPNQDSQRCGYASGVCNQNANGAFDIAGQVEGVCFCDDTCQINRDCCVEYWSTCYIYDLTAATASCVGRCNVDLGLIQQTCYCDTSCISGNDCCTDYYAACQIEHTTCAQRCDTQLQRVVFTSAETQIEQIYDEFGCNCDAGCTGRGDCCSDYPLVCGQSCENNCAVWSAYASCGCDSECTAFSDCCFDFTTRC